MIKHHICYRITITDIQIISQQMSKQLTYMRLSKVSLMIRQFTFKDIQQVLNYLMVLKLKIISITTTIQLKVNLQLLPLGILLLVKSTSIRQYIPSCLIRIKVKCLKVSAVAILSWTIYSKKSLLKVSMIRSLLK